MKLNSKKKNTLSRVWISIFFILVFYLIFIFWGEEIQKKIILTQNNINILSIEKEKIETENLFLKKENQSLLLKNIFSNYYFDRAQFLEKKLNYWEKNKINRKSFKVWNSKDTFYNSLTAVNNGNNNFKENDKVYLMENFVIGKISSVNENFIKIKTFSELNYKNNFAIIQKGEVLFRGEGIGDSSGLIKIILPRKIETDKNSVLILDDGSQDIVGIFLKDIFKSQDTNREVYFKVMQNPNTILEVEI